MVGIECPLDACRKVLRILASCYIAILLMVNHLGDTAHLETHTRRATCHCFHNGVGQVVLQGRGDIEVNRIVKLHHLLRVTDVTDGEDAEWHLMTDVRCFTAHHHQFDV